MNANNVIKTFERRTYEQTQAIVLGGGIRDISDNRFIRCKSPGIFIDIGKA